MNNPAPAGIRHLVVVSGNYPLPSRPAYGTFVRQFVHAVAREGVDCTVVQPVAVHEERGERKLPYVEQEEVGDRRPVTIYRPRFVSLSARAAFARLGPLSPSRFTLWRFTKAVRRVLVRENLRPDALYGHFLYLAGAAAVRVGSQMNIPAFPCAGEGELWTVAQFGRRKARADLSPASGFLANSSALRRILAEELDVLPERIGVFPNGADLDVFQPRDRMEARRRLGLPHDRFLVASVGNFLMKKGVARVGEAIDGLEGVSGVFAGSGPVPPRAAHMALCRRVRPEEIPDVLSASDVFVLPTLVEGSCNALVEAMACGLPIISSRGEFNDDLLDDRMSIRIDPMDVLAIRGAILRLRDNAALRNEMAEASLERARQFDIRLRVRRMLDFMAARIRSRAQDGNPE
jgi:teichuronic acid biosynthesis glycosyltransferase TuaC